MLTKNGLPDKPGIYTLIIKLCEECTVEVGHLGFKKFLKGFYTYTGSALGMKGGLSLKGRIGRHLSSEKKKHWHIDYILNPNFARIVAIVYSNTCSRMECLISKNIEELDDAVVIMEGFGSSDCHRGCRSHLHYFPSVALGDLVRNVREVYERLDLPSHVYLQ